MARSSTGFESFLRAVHRRLVVVRTLERAGFGALAGCAAAGAMIPLLMWHGQAALTPVVAVIGLGWLAGFLWGVAHRPTVLAAAMEADRQLDLHDLLSTAATLRAGLPGGDPWSRTLTAVAEERCRRHMPSQVVLHRYGGRAWGGIGLAASLVLSLAALVSVPGTVPAAASAETSPSDFAPTPRDAKPVRAPGVDPKGMASITGGETAGERRSADPESDSQRPGGDGEANGSASRPGVEDGQRHVAGSDGQGVGAGTSAARRPSPQGVTANAPPRVKPTSLPTAAGEVAGGGAVASARAPGPEGTDSSTSGAADSPREVAPWQGASWAQDAQRAREAIDAGRVPDAYRDLVRDYFDR